MVIYAQVEAQISGPNPNSALLLDALSLRQHRQTTGGVRRAVFASLAPLALGEGAGSVSVASDWLCLTAAGGPSRLPVCALCLFEVALAEGEGPQLAQSSQGECS